MAGKGLKIKQMKVVQDSVLTLMAQMESMQQQWEGMIRSNQIQERAWLGWRNGLQATQKELANLKKLYGGVATSQKEVQDLKKEMDKCMKAVAELGEGVTNMENEATKLRSDFEEHKKEVVDRLKKQPEKAERILAKQMP